MAKYIISTNLSKLPAEVLSVLVESGCTIEKYNAPEVTSSGPATRYTPKGELLKQLSILEEERIIGSYARSAKDYILKGDMDRAIREFNDMSGFNTFKSVDRYYNAYLKANELFGELIG